MSQLPVLQLNFTAMKSLLTENRKLRECLDAEKTRLSSEIEEAKAHLEIVERLRLSRRIPVDLYQKIMSVSESLKAVVLKPSLTFRKSAGVDSTDLSDDLRSKQAQIESLQSEVLELSQERTRLALEEQRVNTARSNALQDLTSARRTCDELILTKEKLEGEVTELEALSDFWRERNNKSEHILKTALTQLSALQQRKDAQSVQLLEELQSMYATLDQASKFVHRHPE
jgi:DNA repair exonuclease SbcCD ATPase subunit